MYYSFSVNKMSKISEERSNKKIVILQNQLEKLNFDKTFEVIIENELDFHGTANIEIHQQPYDLNPCTCEFKLCLMS